MHIKYVFGANHQPSVFSGNFNSILYQPNPNPVNPDHPVILSKKSIFQSVNNQSQLFFVLSEIGYILTS